ncbi:hypothetical protein ACFFLM_05180 [Deinococcus oregonensis]|uniref:Uncharacterized protein n=1 Tax=Deinococcus oregonensis TaxID=1805970 RepID=A0ABV6AV34_9DEIO
MTPFTLPQGHVMLCCEDGVRSRVTYIGFLWVGALSQGVHQLALAGSAQRRIREPSLAEQMPYLILSFTPIQALETRRWSPMGAGQAIALFSHGLLEADSASL